MTSLDLRYAHSVLIKLREKDSFMKYELFDIVTSNQTLDKLLNGLEKDEYIIKKLSVYGRRTYEISLTPKGRIVAENLVHLEESRITIPEGLISEIERIIKRDKSHSSVEEYVNEAVRKAIEKWKKEHAVG